jgi:hypothetical protein
MSVKATPYCVFLNVSIRCFCCDVYYVFLLIASTCNLTKHNETFSSKTNKTTNKFQAKIYVIM